MKNMSVMAMPVGRGKKPVGVMATVVMLLVTCFTGMAHAETTRLDTSSREALLGSLEALSRTTTKADFEEMMFALNLMVVDRSGGKPFRPSPVAVAEVSKEVHGMTPAQIIDKARDLETPPDMEKVDGFYLMGVRPRDKEHSETIYSHILVAAMLGTMPELNLHENVMKDFSDKKLQANIRKIGSAMPPLLQQCIQALGDMRNGQGELADYPELASISRALDVLADRTSDMDSFIKYRNGLMSNFKVFFTTRTERNICREGFVPGLGLPPSGDKARQLCSGFDMLNTCMGELRHEQRLRDGRVDETPK